MSSSWHDLFGDGPTVLDAGLSTQVERRGIDVGGPLWTARLLADDPDVIRRAHEDFVAAGAQAIVTGSYQVSRRGFESAGLSAADADAALVTSTAVARMAAGSGVRVAASVGPYGAILHDGSEYRGRYGLTRGELVDFHRERLDVLVATGPDLLAVETIPDVEEALALAEVLADHPGLPAWMSFSAADEARTCAGQPIEDAVLAAHSAPSVVAVGVNCTRPTAIEGLVRRMAAASDLPVVVYPNAGGTWDAGSGAWTGATSSVFADDLVRSWLRAGAVAVGGCCGTDDRTIRTLVSQLGGIGS